MKHEYIIGKCDYNNSGKWNCLAVVEWELELKKGTYAFSMSGSIWNPRHTDIYCGGQCLETILELFPEDKLIARMVEVWRDWHLSDMKSGSPAQEKAIEQYKRDNPAWRYDYTQASDYLESIGLNPDQSYLHNGRPYQYGSDWLATPLPSDILAEIESWKNLKENPVVIDPFTQWIDATFVYKAVLQEEMKYADKYLCTLIRKDNPKISERIEYTQGKAHRIANNGAPWDERKARVDCKQSYQVNHTKSAPKAAMVFDAMINDAKAYNDNRDVLDFISELCYEDAKEGRRVWQACETQFHKLQQLAGKDFHTLLSDDECPEMEAA